MKRQVTREQQVEQTLSSLDGLQGASPKPFFYTRLQARLNAVKTPVWEKIVTFIARPAVTVAVITTVLMVNGWAAFKEEKTAPIAVSEQQVADDYPLAIATPYDYENELP
jgi:hypothetical protein